MRSAEEIEAESKKEKSEKKKKKKMERIVQLLVRPPVRVSPVHTYT